MVMAKVPKVLVGLNIELPRPDVSLLVGCETDSRVSNVVSAFGFVREHKVVEVHVAHCIP